MDLAEIRIIDTHVHLWDPFTTPRKFGGTAKLSRYLPIPVDVAKKLAPKRDLEFTGDPTVYLSKYLPPDYRADVADVSIDHFMHMEVEWAGKGPLAKADETKWLANLPTPDGLPLCGIIGSADPAADRFSELLDAHQAASPLFRGVRTMVGHHPDPGVRSFCKVEKALTAPAFLDGFGHLAERGLSFDAWVYSHALPDVTALAKRYPEVTIIIDHFGTPAGIFGPVGKHTGSNPSMRRELFLRWRDDFAELAGNANVVAKCSGAMMPILGHPVPPRGTSTSVEELLDRIGPLVEHALQVFGTERMLWGSNFPLDRAITSIANGVRAIAEAVTGNGGGQAELEQVFRGTAQRVYRLAL
ncbi:amidohydrolase family protein [Nocardia goodfellowii]|uniref:TIM-barrel fold metal-dependent hydrolase n=1 Tax=Nocardia goodfellowii TaxID=882446 RepID=A0ABS4Q629_9NOCA|nr:amidohydrolase family protein [Nocardia goodfellowii]MBP2187140.1 putative TIM-barrel fold metal-dependent hydrolase [Nocardia goodfellowii]